MQKYPIHEEPRKACLYWDKETSQLCSVMLFDENDSCIVKCGDERNQDLKHEVELSADERIVGIVSYNDNGYAFHQDF